jgi:FkbM family methyltransferase
MASRQDEKDIVIYHIGGEGEYGPSMCISERMRGHVNLVVFEVRSDTEDEQISKTLIREGVPTTVINRGIDEFAGVAPFHVNKFPLSSSLLPLSPLAAGENPAYRHCHTWGQNAELDHTITVETVSLDDIVDAGLAPAPDVISIDAQGAELRILRGAKKALASALCVVTEVEFFEIYDGQGLFDDQMTLLGEAGYRLFNVFNTQYWHPGPAAGAGFLTVGEAGFLRYACAQPSGMPGKRGYLSFDDLSDAQLTRLAGIALSFNALSYAYAIGTVLRTRAPRLLAQLAEDPWYQPIPQLLHAVELNLDQYRKNPLLFLNAFSITNTAVPSAPRTKSA